MSVVAARSGAPIRLPDERWRHIVAGHPEFAEERDRLAETLADSDLIQDGDSGELLAVRFYERTPLTRKHLVVAYRELDRADGFVLTAYFTRRPTARRMILWKR